ncbi:EndoU domain-containing protein [Ramlibacter sp. AN1015]|uniref:EndoU domain-containing protein n=1 Tax=Ramlibacter sp. AN1015 TaxID=3133428 RepID=UPI0040406EE8
MALTQAGVPRPIADVLVQGTATTLAAAVGGDAAGAAAFNEAANNGAAAVPGILQGLMATGVVAARQCVASNVCMSAVAVLGAAAVEDIRRLANAEDANTPPPGYEPQRPDAAGGNTASPNPGPRPAIVTASPAVEDPLGNRRTSGYRAVEQPPGGSTTVSPVEVGGVASNLTLSSGERRPSAHLPPLIDEIGAEHILWGEGPNRGGHLWPGQPGKTSFPESWSSQQVLQTISDIARDPASARETGARGRVLVTGTRDGVTIMVVTEPPSRGGRIVTGYPINLPRNPK